MADNVVLLKEKYRSEVVPKMMKEFGYANVMEVPRLERVTVNIGLGEAIQNPKAMESAEQDITAITGQHPVITRARKSIAAFKVRKGMAVGMMVTLRGRRMYDFLDKLFNAVLPRIRDFQGIAQTSFDGRGNYSLGLKEQIIFPEIDYDKVDRIRGMQITVVTTARNNEEGRKFLELMGMPFKRT
ncbi:50S ribosomal protein L5 [Chloroflexota bacterium]